MLTTYTGDPHIGNRLRGPSNLLDTEYTTRLPKTGFPTLDGHDDIVYTAEDFALCSDATWCPDWMTWQACVENAQVHLTLTLTLTLILTLTLTRTLIDNAQVHQREMSGQFWNNASGLHWMHSQFHAKIGSYTGPWPANFPFMSNRPLVPALSIVYSTCYSLGVWLQHPADNGRHDGRRYLSERPDICIPPRQRGPLEHAMARERGLR